MIKFSPLNPFQFTTEYSTREEIQDIVDNTDNGNFCQEFSMSDFITFQIFYEDDELRYGYGNLSDSINTIKIEININGENYLYRKINGISDEKRPNYCFVTRFIHQTGWEGRGYFLFYNPVYSILSDIGYFNIKETDCFKIIVSFSMNNGGKYITFTSNSFKIKYRSLQKRILYSQQYRYGNVSLGTDFTYLKIDKFHIFCLRVPADFVEVESLSDNEIFNDYEYNPVLVSSIPYESYLLRIGGDSGIPIWMQKTLNYALHTDFKYIDNYRYELNDGEMSFNRLPEYGNVWGDVHVSRIEDYTFSNMKGELVISSRDNHEAVMIIFIYPINRYATGGGYWQVECDKELVMPIFPQNGYCEYGGMSTFYLKFPPNKTSQNIEYTFTLRNMITGELLDSVTWVDVQTKRRVHNKVFTKIFN